MATAGEIDTPDDNDDAAGALSDLDDDEPVELLAAPIAPPDRDEAPTERTQLQVELDHERSTSAQLHAELDQERSISAQLHAELDQERSTSAQLQAEREFERSSRQILESAKADGDAKFLRLKTLIQEAARQRDEAYRLRDESARQVEALTRERDEIARQRDEIARQRDEGARVRDEAFKARDEAAKARDGIRAEVGEVARMLIAANEKVTAMASGAGMSSFGRGLPASKYSGLQAIAFGFGKRVEEVLEEVLRQREGAVKAQREVREEMEQRSYAVAIEVSGLEEEVEAWKRQALIKDEAILDLQEKVGVAEGEADVLREVEGRLRSQGALQEEMVREGLLSVIPKVRKCLLELPHDLVEDNSWSHEESESRNGDEKTLSLLQRCVAEVRLLLELGTRIGVAWTEKKEEWERSSRELVTAVEKLEGQKRDAAELLAAALAEKQQVLESISDLRVKLSQENLEVERLQTSLKEAQELAEQGRVSDEEEENEELVRIRAELSSVAQGRDEALSKVTALENEGSKLRQQIGELEIALAGTRSEVGELRTLANTQSKELAEKVAQIKEILLQMKDYTADIEALEEEVGRWKQAATDEAAAGAAVMEDLDRCQFEVSELHQQIDRLKISVEEATLKLRSKEEMAVAAIAARSAAERSLQIADERAAELRERLEELNKQVEEADLIRDYRLGVGWLDSCWPSSRNRQRTSNRGGTQLVAEMEELLEPLV